MRTKLKILMHEQHGEMNIQLEGVIDEDSDFTLLMGRTSTTYRFDFEKIKVINSCGVREWVKLLDQINHARVEYINCPIIIIDQVNMVYGLLRKNISVKSFYAPYFCPKCDDEKKVLVQFSDIKNLKIPIIKCSKCDEDLDFDGIERQYFNFLTCNERKVE